jgi:hypothetical protein
LGVQQQQQALQTGQATQSSAQSAASIAGQTAKENQNLAKLIADPVGNGIANPDGTPTDKAADIYMAAAPTTWGQHYDNLVATAQRKVEFNNTVNNLKTNERAEVANTVAGAASGAQSPQDIKDAVANLVATKQGTPLAADYQTISGLVNAQLDHVTQATQGRNPMPPGQEPWRTAALNIGASVLPAAQTAGVGGLGRPQQGTNAAGQNQLVSPVTGARSNPQLVGGAINPTSPQVAGATAAATLPYVGPAAAASASGGALGSAQTANLTGAAARVQQAQAAANNTVQSQDALSRAKAILEAPGAPSTGTQYENIKGLKNLMSSLGIDTQGADDMNTLTKNLARYEASRATQAGLGGTDAARELAHSGSPNTQLDNKALLGIVRQSLATEQAVASYANIQSKATTPQQLLQNEAAFRSIPNHIQAREFSMMRSPQEADAYLQSQGMSKAQMAAARQQVKQFDSQ